MIFSGHAVLVWIILYTLTDLVILIRETNHAKLCKQKHNYVNVAFLWGFTWNARNIKKRKFWAEQNWNIIFSSERFCIIRYSRCFGCLGCFCCLGLFCCFQSHCVIYIYAPISSLFRALRGWQILKILTHSTSTSGICVGIISVSKMFWVWKKSQGVICSDLILWTISVLSELI